MKQFVGVSCSIVLAVALVIYVASVVFQPDYDHAEEEESVCSCCAEKSLEDDEVIYQTTTEAEEEDDDSDRMGTGIFNSIKRVNDSNQCTDQDVIQRCEKKNKTAVKKGKGCVCRTVSKCSKTKV